MKKLLALLLCVVLLAAAVPAAVLAEDASTGLGGEPARYAAAVAARNNAGMGEELIALFLPGVVNYLVNTLKGMEGKEEDAEGLKSLYAAMTDEQKDGLNAYVMARYCGQFPHRVSNEALFEFFGAAVYEWYATTGKNLFVNSVAQTYNAAADSVNASVDAILAGFA